MQSDADRKLERSRCQFKAASALVESGFPNEGSALAWFSVRTAMFLWHELRGASYNGTRSAIVKYLQAEASKQYRADLMLAYSIGNLVEWDENFRLTESQASEFLKMCERLVDRLGAC